MSKYPALTTTHKEPWMNFQAAIFDMDGLLDTERLYADFEEACHAQGVPF